MTRLFSIDAGRAPPVEPPFAAYPCQPAPARHSCDTQKGPLTAASFRTWRSSRAPAAQDPAFCTT